jgi:dihydrodipicolinate synthase/N-acetylneuraminate lyase
MGPRGPISLLGCIRRRILVRGQEEFAEGHALGAIMKWSGIFAGLTTPFDHEGRFNCDGYRRNIEHVIAGGVQGVIALAVMGEGPSLTLDEIGEVTRATVAAVAGRVPVLATVGGPNERYTAMGIEIGEAAGVDGLMLLPAYFYPLTLNEMIQHLARVGATTSLPLMIYNSTYSNVPLTPDAIDTLLTVMPNFVALKEGNQLQASEVTRRFGDRLDVFTARDTYIHELLAAGGAGATSFTAAVVPRLVVSLYEAARDGDWAASLAFQRKLSPLCSLMVRHSFPAGVKAALDLAGLAGGATRPPLIGYTKDEVENVRQELAVLGVSR